MSAETTLYTLRVELVGSEPLIWRLIEVDGALALDRFHLVLQSAMGWTDSHLHSFADRDPFEPPRSGLSILPRTWLDPGSLDEGLEGFDETAETVAGALQLAGGRLWYEYDFGDSWSHSISQVSTRTAGAGDPPANVLDGERRAPLEDCGGVGGWADLLALWEGRSTGVPELDEEAPQRLEWIVGMQGFGRMFDPAEFNADAANADLSISFAEAPYLEHDAVTGVDAPLADVIATGHRAARWLAGLDRWCRHEFGAALQRAGVDALGTPRPVPLPAGGDDAVVPYQWIVRVCSEGGLALTATGNLSQAGVRQVLGELGWQRDETVYRGGKTEANAGIVAMLRESAIGAGLVRKSGRKLEATAAGRKLAGDPAKLWQRLAERAIPARSAPDKVDATMLELLVTAEGKTRATVRGAVLQGMAMRGYVHADGSPLGERDYFRRVDQFLDTRYVLAVAGRPAREWPGWPDDAEPITALERAFALAVLQA